MKKNLENMLKIYKENKLQKTLKDLEIPICPLFAEGYHKCDIKKAIKYARKFNFFYNIISNKEIIISKKEICLGKKKMEYIDGNIVISYHSIQEYKRINKIYEKIKFLESVPKMIFKNNLIYQEYKTGIPLYKGKPNKNHKNLLIKFIKGLNSLGFAHRDLHCKNIIISEKNLWVIDWDFVTWQNVNILKCYDITGYGLESPHLTYNTSIFKKFNIVSIPSVAEILNIKLSDFF